jgi:hypothetical protein
MNPHTHKGASTLGVGIMVDSQIFREQLQGSKPNGLKSFFITLESSWNIDVKMGLHNPFGHLKHKLGSKERLGVKLVIWLPTTKSQESPRFPYVKVACEIPLESSWQGLQLCFRPHLNRRSAHKVMGPQNCESPETKWHLGAGLVARLWWVLWIWVCPWLVLAPKMFQLCTNQLVVWFCVCSCEWLNVCHSS